jgi:hypothetical protein
MVVVSATHLSEPGPQVMLDGSVEGRSVMSSHVAHQQPVAVRVQPGGSAWHFSSRFFHTEWKSKLELVDHQESETDSCGRRDSRGNCQSTTRYVTRSRLESVTRLVEVDDARCRDDAAYLLDAGRSYRIAYFFRGDKQCGSTCLDVTDDPAGAACTRVVIQPRVAAAAPSEDAAPSHGGPLRGAGTALVVLGAMGMVAGGIGIGYAFDRKQALHEHCDANRTCDSEGLAAAQQGKTANTLAAAGLGAGGAVLATGVAFLVFGPSERPSAAAAATQGGAQLTFRGSF